jgi:hypothetical protein
MAQKVIHLENNVVVILQYSDFANEINVDDLMSIDSTNILGEVLTFPVILNRFGLILAEKEDDLRRTNFLYETKLDEVKNELAKAYGRAFSYFQSEAGGSVKNPTGAQCENRAKEDEIVLEKKKDADNIRNILLDVQKERDLMNSLYWSAKSKDEKLNKLTEKLSPRELESELIDGLINGVMIKKTKSLMG